MSVLLNDCSAVAFYGPNRCAAPRLQKNANATHTKNQSDCKSKEKEVICVDGVCHVRGGAYLEDDEYDGDFYDEEEEELPPPRLRPPPQSSRRRQPPPQSRRGPPPGRRGPPPPRRRGPPPPYRGRRPKQPSLLGSAAGLAKKTADLTATAAVGTIKGSGKAAFYLVSPKHVTRREVWGVWRLDQQGIVHSLLFLLCFFGLFAHLRLFSF